MSNNQRQTDNFIAVFCKVLETPINQSPSYTVAKETRIPDGNLNYGEKFAAILNKEKTKK